MRHRLRVLSLAALIVLAGCGQRERLNPFDPANPTTGGHPADFVALAGDGLVTLRWRFVAAEGLLGYQMFRRMAGDTAFAQLGGLIPPTVTATGDFGLPNGIDHTYRLYYVFDRGLGQIPAEDVATPGPLVPWVADYARGQAILFTADGRRVFSEDPSYVGPIGIAADPARGLVWVSDTDAGRIVVYSPSSATHVNITTTTSPASLALDPVDGTAWVCDAPNDAVFHFQTNGAPASPAQLNLLDNPLDVATDPVDRSVWVCERGGNRMRHYDRSGSPTGAVDLTAPSRAAVDSVTHGVWVTSFTTGRLYAISNAPAVSDSVSGFSGPIGVAVDSRRGRVWVADAAGNQVVAVGRNNLVQFRVTAAGEPREVAVDPTTGNAWVTLASAGRVMQISPAGTVIRSLSGFARPDGISIGVNP